MKTETQEDGTRPTDSGTAPAGRTEMHPELTYDGPIDREACDRLLRIIHRLDGVDEAYESTGSERRESRSSKRYERYRKTVLNFLAEAGRRAARAATYLAGVHDEARADGIDFGDDERDGGAHAGRTQLACRLLRPCGPGGGGRQDGRAAILSRSRPPCAPGVVASRRGRAGRGEGAGVGTASYAASPATIKR